MESITFAIVGSGGAGVVSLGEMALKAAESVGYYGLMRKSFGPQIRGGESAAIIRLANHPVSNFCGKIHYLFVLDWNNFSRFDDEILITDKTIIIQDAKAGEAPAALQAYSQVCDFTSASAAVGSDKANMSMLGFIGAWLGCTSDRLETYIRHRLKKLDDAIQNISVEAMRLGISLQSDFSLMNNLPLKEPNGGGAKRWLATGNQLAGLGALEAGIKFVAAYPITPASDCLEWVANHIESVGGHLVQAEDELSAINMIVGAGYSGLPSMTATSGPGLSLMSEAMGLAIASETPTVILNVMRGGPSTGIPTKSEQSDFNIAVYGMHGDAPHIVLSALTIEDCYTTMAWATALATELQTLVIVLSDQFMGQSSQVIEPLPEVPFTAKTFNGKSSSEAAETGDAYARYKNTESGISPMMVPGVVGCMYTADGLEHSENAIPSPKASDHQLQLDKRQRKIERYEYGEYYAEISGEADFLLVCWGSTYSTAREAQALLFEKGIAIKVLGLRQLLPLAKDKVVAEFKSASQALVVEQNHQGQFAQFLRSFNLPGVEFEVFTKPGPILITPSDICDVIEKQLKGEAF